MERQTEPTKADYVLGAIAWVLLAPLAIGVVGAVGYELATTLWRFVTTGSG